MSFVKPEDVLDAAKGMLERGLVSGTAGNVSGRIDENRVCLTPSSVPYETMTLDDLVVTDLDGNVVEGTRGPTSEKALHLSCFRKYPEIGGVRLEDMALITDKGARNLTKFEKVLEV